MAEQTKNYDYMGYGKAGDKVMLDVIGFVSTKNVRTANDGGVQSFGLPLENVGNTISSIFPADFPKGSLPETNWINTVMFNSDNVKLADRFAKAIAGKARVRVRVSGLGRIHEYNGKKSVELVANDFHILWSETFKGTNIGGGSDGYSYVSGMPIEAGKALVAIQGFVNKPELRPLPDGRHVLGFGVALNKANKSLTHIMGQDVAGDPIWVDVAIFDNDHFAQAERAAKVLRHGAALAGIGYAKTEEYEGKVRIRLSLNDFDVLKYAKDGEQAAAETVTTPMGGTGTVIETSTPFDSHTGAIDFDDDDLPF